MKMDFKEIEEDEAAKLEYEQADKAKAAVNESLKLELKTVADDLKL